MRKNFTINHVFLFGFVLILVVAAVTFFRSAVEKSTTAGPNTGPPSVSSKVKIIEPEKVSQKLIFEETAPIVLDLRSEADFKKEHILDSINVTADDFSQNLDLFDPEKSFVLIDEGRDSKSALMGASFLIDKGYRDIGVVEGGIIGWKNKGLPTISYGDPESFVDQSKVSYIGAEEVKSAIEQNAAALTIIDVRTESEFKKERLPYAKNIPLDKLEKQRGEIAFSKPVIVYANENIESYQAAVRLFDMGYFKVKILMGGIKGWKEKQFPVESEE